MKNNRIKITTLSILASSLLLSACGEDSQPATTVEQVPVAVEAATINAEISIDESTQADGIAAPLDFSLTNLAGEAVLSTDYQGKWLVLNYWATWCAPCRDEMPELVKFQAENDQVQVLGIAYEDAEVEKLQNFAADFNINYPLLTIDVYNPPEFAQEGGLGLPTTIVYNPEGMRHKKHMGPIDAEGLMEMLQ